MRLYLLMHASIYMQFLCVNVCAFVLHVYINVDSNGEMEKGCGSLEASSSVKHVHHPYFVMVYMLTCTHAIYTIGLVFC